MHPSLVAGESRPNHLPIINWVFLGSGAIGLIAVASSAWGNPGAPGPAILWALGTMAGGALVGLLFGIPRMQQAQPEKTSTLQPVINNNLVEVSDWLTKMLVGLGLVQLTELPGIVRDLTAPLAACFPPASGPAMAQGLFWTFGLLGFFLGYINARTAIAQLIRRSDDELVRTVESLNTRLSAEVIAAEARNELRARARIPEKPVQQVVAAPDAELMRLAHAYTAIEHPEKRVRIELKDQAAMRIHRHALASGISKEGLTELAKQHASDGLLVGLATMVLAQPEPEDLRRLVAVAPLAKWLHTQFRLAHAFQKLLRLGLVEDPAWAQVVPILRGYLEHARRRRDSSLENLVVETLNMLRAEA